MVTKQANYRTLILFEVSLLDAGLSAAITCSHIELINLVRHIRAYPSDSLENAFRNVFDFDVYKPDTIDYLYEVMHTHGCVDVFLSNRDR